MGRNMAKESGPQVNWVGAIGSGLGSVTSAVLLSTTGAAGTWIGAGIGTFIITVGGAIYAYYLQRAKTGIEKTADKLKTGVQSKRPQNITSISAERDPNDPTRTTSTATDVDTGSQAAGKQDKPTFKEALKNIRWKRVAGLGILLFAITMAIIFIFELATGRPVSSYTGGTSPDSTGTSITGVQDPARDEPAGTPQELEESEEQLENPENPQVPLEEQQPEQAPEVPEEDVAPIEPEPEQVPEVEAPQPEQRQQLQDEPVEAPQ
jgi:hypothetical protein